MKIIEDIENNEEQNLNKSISKETVPAAATEISEEAGTALTKASEVPVESGAPSDAAPEAEITEEADSALIAAPGAGSEMLEKQEPESEIADRADIEPKVASGNEGGMPEEETSADSKDETDSTNNAAKGSAKSRKKSRSKRRARSIKFSSRVLVISVIVELLIAAAAILAITQLVSLNKDDEIIFADSQHQDEISCSNGMLNVNDVSANVPAGNGVSYSISYSWGSEDTEYPSVPHAATASYASEDGTLLYDISLYRDSFTPKAEISEGTDETNWFDDWQEEKTSTTSQRSYKAKNFDGFMITSIDRDSDGRGTAYKTSSFYFAVPSDDGISIYILEGVLYDKGSDDSFKRAMSQGLHTLDQNENKSQDKSKDKDADNDGSGEKDSEDKSEA